MARDPTTTTEYKEQRAAFQARQDTGHWTGKSQAQRDKEAAAREARRNQSIVSRGVGKALSTGREIDKYVKMLEGK
jgi:hypothetical protein